MEETIYSIQYYSEKLDKWCNSLFDSNIDNENIAYNKLEYNRKNFHYRKWRLVKKTITTEILSG